MKILTDQHGSTFNGNWNWVNQTVSDCLPVVLNHFIDMFVRAAISDCSVNIPILFLDVKFIFH